MRVSTTEIFLVDIIQYLYGFRYLNIQSIRNTQGRGWLVSKFLNCLRRCQKLRKNLKETESDIHSKSWKTVRNQNVQDLQKSMFNYSKLETFAETGDKLHQFFLKYLFN